MNASSLIKTFEIGILSSVINMNQLCLRNVSMAQ